MELIKSVQAFQIYPVISQPRRNARVYSPKFVALNRGWRNIEIMQLLKIVKFTSDDKLMLISK